MRDGTTRDRWRDELGIICFEMDAAGLMDNLGSLVISVICDYSDLHKNKAWQAFAAARAAAYAKALLHVDQRNTEVQARLSFRVSKTNNCIHGSRSRQIDPCASAK